MDFIHSDECLSHQRFLLSLVKTRLGLTDFVHHLFNEAIHQGTAFRLMDGRKNEMDAFYPGVHFVDCTGHNYFLVRDTAGIYAWKAGEDPMAALIAPSSTRARPPVPGENRGGGKGPIPGDEDQARTLHYYRGWTWLPG